MDMNCEEAKPKLNTTKSASAAIAIFSFLHLESILFYEYVIIPLFARPVEPDGEGAKFS